MTHTTGWMSTLIPVTFPHVDINKMAWEQHLRKTIPQICQDYIFMRSPARHPRRSPWWHQLMYIPAMNFVCQTMPRSAVAMVTTDLSGALATALTSANTQLKRPSCWGHSNQCAATEECNERMMERCLQEAAATQRHCGKTMCFISASPALPIRQSCQQKDA